MRQTERIDRDPVQGGGKGEVKKRKGERKEKRER
jgi:hypothetical protein